MAPKTEKTSTVGKDLKRLRENARPPLTVREIAALLGFDSHTTYAYYEDGYKKQFLPQDLTNKLVKVLGERGVDRSAVLALGGLNEKNGARSVTVSADQEEYTPIGRYDASFSMGPGSLVEEHPEPLGFWMLEAHWLNAITRAAPDHLAIVKADGDSMQPTLLGGDWVLIDRTQTRLSREGIYAIRVGGDVWIKRLSLNLRDKTVRIISDNPTTPPQDVEEDQLAVVGKVVALVARRLP